MGIYFKQNDLENFKLSYADLTKSLENNTTEYIITLIELLRERAGIADEKGDIKEATDFYEKIINLAILSTSSRNSIYRQRIGIYEIAKKLSSVYHLQNEPKKAYDLAINVYGAYSVNSLVVDNTLKLAGLYEKEDIAKAEDLYKKTLENVKENRAIIYNPENFIRILEAYSNLLSKIPERKKEVEEIQERIKKLRENKKNENSN